MDNEDVLVLDDEHLQLLEELAKREGVTPEKEAENLIADFCKQGG